MSEPYPVSPWRVTCSKCQQQGPPSGNIRGAVALAETAGWEVAEIRGQRVTLCPDCAEAAREWHNAPAIIWSDDSQVR